MAEETRRKAGRPPGPNLPTREKVQEYLWRAVKKGPKNLVAVVAGCKALLDSFPEQPKAAAPLVIPHWPIAAPVQEQPAQSTPDAMPPSSPEVAPEERSAWQ